MPTPAFLVRPFSALRPTPQQAADLAAPPYDVVDRAEARALIATRPQSFLRVSRADTEFGDDASAYDDHVYARAAANLAALRERGALVRDEAPAYYVYRIGNDAHQQTGVAAGASISAYRDNRIRRHEHTRPAKETDRVRHIRATGAMSGLVLLAHRPDATLTTLCAGVVAAAPPLLRARVDGWEHEVWRIDDIAVANAVGSLLNAQPALYIADGHHRSAAATRIADEAVAVDAFPAVSFPADELRILPYHRVVSDLGGRSAAGFLTALSASFSVTPAAEAVAPTTRGHFGLYLDQRWYALQVEERGPTALDADILAQRLLEPLLGISDPRNDSRIDFVGGSRGTAGVAARVDDGDMAAGFTLCATTMAEIMAVADADDVMPPKSTWFEPKLADGLLSLELP